MRIRHFLTLFVPVVVTLMTGPSAEAQHGAPYPSVGPAWYNGSPGYGPMPGQAVPPTYQPHPAISPYDHVLDQTYNSDGLWFRNALNGFGPFNRPRDYFFSVDYLLTKTRDLQGIVGDENVQTYLEQQSPGNEGTTTGIGIRTGLEYFPYFDAARATMIPQLTNNGIRLNGGFWNPDGTGLLVSAQWSADSTSTYDARKSISGHPFSHGEHRLSTQQVLENRRNNQRLGDGPTLNLGGITDQELIEDQILAPGSVFDEDDTLDYGIFGGTFNILDRYLMNLHGIPIANGGNPFVVEQVPLGITVPYDMEFVLRHSLSSYGAQADAAFSPIYERSSLVVRPILGGRYYRIDEGFRFDGVDSGLAYPGGEAGVDDYTAVNPLVRAFLQSQAISDLAGPQLGLHYQLGDNKGISFTGATRVGVMMNNERVKIQGDNIGNHMGIEVDAADGGDDNAIIVTDVFDTDTTDGPSPNAFRDSYSSSHVSPLFEQGLNAQIPLFQHVPILRNVWQLDGASASVGWTYLLIGEVADPNQSISWASRPTTGLFPKVKVERDNFSQHSFNFGINWQY